MFRSEAYYPTGSRWSSNSGPSHRRAAHGEYAEAVRAHQVVVVAGVGNRVGEDHSAAGKICLTSGAACAG